MADHQTRPGGSTSGRISSTAASPSAPRTSWVADLLRLRCWERTYSSRSSRTRSREWVVRSSSPPARAPTVVLDALRMALGMRGPGRQPRARVSQRPRLPIRASTTPRPCLTIWCSLRSAASETAMTTPSPSCSWSRSRPSWSQTASGVRVDLELAVVGEYIGWFNPRACTPRWDTYSQPNMKPTARSRLWRYPLSPTQCWSTIRASRWPLR